MNYEGSWEQVDIITASKFGPYQAVADNQGQAEFSLWSFLVHKSRSCWQIMALGNQLKLVNHWLHDSARWNSMGLAAVIHEPYAIDDQPDWLQALIDSNELAIQAIALISADQLESEAVIELIAQESVVIAGSAWSGHNPGDRSWIN